MIEQLFKKLEVKRKLSKQSKDLLSEHVVVKKYQRGETFLELGNFSNEVGFILSGVFRTYVLEKGEGKSTKKFIIQNECMTNFKSFHGNLKSDFAIESETESVVAIITRDAWDIFEKEIPDWKNTVNYIHNSYLIEIHNFQREILNQEALTCYRCFCDKFPAVVHNVPLGHVASFLGITQSTLSRIRKKDLNH